MAVKTPITEAGRIYRRFQSRDPEKICDGLGITILPCAFKKQKGAYKIIERNAFIFIKNDLDPVMRDIVLLHEIGHHLLHRDAALSTGGFHEFVLFDMRQNKMEYEANMFASEISLPDGEILEMIYNGYDVSQIAAAMHSDINLVALKVASLNSRGYKFREQEHKNTFLR